jgi:fibronectin type 3 domain-containing protein
MDRENQLRKPFGTIGVFLLLASALAGPAWAIRPKGKANPLDGHVVVSPETRTMSQVVDFRLLGSALTPAQLKSILPTLEAFDAFEAASGTRWIANFDRVTGKPSLIEGGLPWIPGSGMGNQIRAEEIGATEAEAAGNSVPVEIVADKARRLLETYPALFGVDTADLELMRGASGPMLDYLYYVDFQWTWHGIPVENAHVVFRLNSGNLVQIGQENVCDSIKKLDPEPLVSRDLAWQALWSRIGGKDPGDQILEPGRLSILPVSSKALLSGDEVDPGAGMEYRLIWTLQFSRAGQMGSWQARIDAHGGELVSFEDINAYGHIQGGVYKADGRPTPVSSAFPYADYSGSAWADAAGDFTGTTGTSTLSGRTGSATTVGSADITDNCGTISLVANASGLIDFGTSSGTDCTTPGIGGNGNTHSSRTQYWNIAAIKTKAYTYLTGNNWLEGKLTANVNINQVCNAYWSPTAGTVNFFRSGTYYGTFCYNTGELPGVSLHEWAHGMDKNDGNNSSPDGGSGETYGDTSAFLQTHGSCIGAGFLKTSCDGYGDACKACTGVRDVDYTKHQSGSPATPTWDNTYCPGGYSCQGPCAGECHCESAPSSQANWDLATVDLITWGMDATTAWQTLDRFWYASRPSATRAYECGTNTSCNAGNLFNVYRVVDDCDGVLTNGTPHASAIWAAFNRHQIGCSTAVNTNNNCGCATLATPVLAGTAGNGSVNLTWGAISGAASYDVYRNDTSCTAGFTLAGNTTATSFTNSPLSNGTTYYFRVQAKGSGSCPPSSMSNCVTLTPVAGSCTAPGAPTLNSATGTCSGVDLAWTAGTGTTNSYNVYRKDNSCTGGTYVKIAGPLTGTTTYSDTTAVSPNTYAYAVKGACDTGGVTESTAYSNCLTATPLAVPTIPAAPTVTDDCTGLIVSWAAIPGAATYNVLRRSGGCGNNSWATVTTGETGLTWTDTTAATGTTYGYYIQAVGCSVTSGDKANCTALAHSAAGAPAAPGAPTLTAGCTNVSLSWTAVSGATDYEVWHAAAGSCTSATQLVATTGGATTYNHTGLTNGSQHSYSIKAKSACGTSAAGSCATTTTLTAPAAPGVPTLTPGCTNVSLSWTAVSGATDYEVWRNAGASCTGATVVVSTTGGATTYNNTGLTVGTQYSYLVKAKNTCGTSGNGSCATTTTLATPAVPTGLTATGTCSGNDLSWGNVSGATSYNVLRGATCGGVAQIASGVATTAYSDTTATSGVTYFYAVQAVNTCGASTSSTCASATTLATPAAPGAPALTPGCTNVSLSWTAVSGATDYEVWRNAGASCTGAAVVVSTTGGATTYNNTGLAGGTQYSYSIKAKNACGTSAAGTCATTTTLAVPAAPGAPTYTAVSCNTLTVNWTAVSGATSYDVYRRNTSCGTGTLQGNVATTSYNATGLTASSTYAWYVVAKNGCGDSASGSCNTVTTTGAPTAPGAPTLTPACTSVALSWTAVSGATDYEIWHNAGGSCTGATQLASTTGGATTFSHTGLTNGTAHSYQIRAKNSCGTSVSGTCASTTTLNVPAAPTGVGATPSCTGVSVTWNNSAGATGYDVVRGTVCGTAVTTFSNVTSPYSDSTGTPGTAYQYWVVAKNACGNSANSTCAAGTRTACPDLVYKNNSFSVSQLQGDSDATSMIPGEKWRLSFVLTNQGVGAATSAQVTVTANNGVSSANFCVNPMSVGTVLAGADSATLQADFIVPSGWSGSCPSDVQFGFTAKLHNGGQSAGTDEAAGSASVLQVKKAIGMGGAGTPTNTALAAVADAWIDKGNTGTNYGSDSILRAGKTGVGNTAVRGLIRFDLSSIPAGSTINSAVLQLNAVAQTGTNRTENLLQVTSTWAEGTVTWDTAPSASGTASGTLSTGSTLGTKTSTDITTLVQGWFGTPSTNYGVLLQDGTESNNVYWNFSSRENGTAANRPQLLINYTPPASMSCTAWTGTASCSAALPPPVPDGSVLGQSPMRVEKVAGGQVRITWDVSSCTATNYNIYRTAIGNYTTFTAGSCAVGTTGSWTGSIAESDVWWGIAGTNGSDLLSSIAKQSDGTENPTTGWAGICATQTTRNTSGTCP